MHIRSSETKNTETANCLRELLIKDGYRLRNRSGLFKLGPDIKATRDSENWYIEVAGFEESNMERIEDFYKVFFRSISRLNNEDCDHCIVAIPDSLKKFLYIRARIYRVAWERLSKAFPELEIWVVDAEKKKYQRTPWIYWLSKKRLF
jgi:hypothetical protein